MPKHYLHYWKPSTVEAELESQEGLSHIASDQLSLQRVHSGDTLWLVTVYEGRLFLVGCLVVDQVIVGQEAAEVFFGTTDLWKARYHIAAQVGTIELLRVIELAEIAKQLTFQSKDAPRLTIQDGKCNPQQLQSTRVLTPDAADLLAEVWQTRLNQGKGAALFKGISVHRQEILGAIDNFDQAYPDTNQYDIWLEKNSYKFAIRYRGKLYPCKHILSEATGINTGDFSGGEDTNRVFRQLGFTVIARPFLEDDGLNELLTDEHFSADEVDVSKHESFIEGAIKQVYVNRYERDPRARRACVRHYGYVCCICGFDFEQVYGEVGADFIHVHHLRPFGEVNASYELDPVHDLRPVCANCHAIIHRRKQAYSIEEVKAFLSV